jgi:ApbE superfamily uncharacterized protein (UPF0280 family)
MGVATSSGKFSHAFSLGDADAVTVFAENAGLADAVATAVGNIIKGDDKDDAIKQGIHKTQSISGVKGIVILYEDKIGCGGTIPQLLHLKNDNKVSKEILQIGKSC